MLYGAGPFVASVCNSTLSTVECSAWRNARKAVLFCHRDVISALQFEWYCSQHSRCIAMFMSRGKFSAGDGGGAGGDDDYWEDDEEFYKYQETEDDLHNSSVESFDDSSFHRCVRVCVRACVCVCAL